MTNFIFKAQINKNKKEPETIDYTRFLALNAYNPLLRVTGLEPVKKASITTDFTVFFFIHDKFHDKFGNKPFSVL